MKHTHAMLSQAAILSHFSTFRQETIEMVIVYSTWRASLSALLISSANVASPATSATQLLLKKQFEKINTLMLFNFTAVRQLGWDWEGKVSAGW